MKALGAAIIVVLIFAGFVLYAPNYLFYADTPRKSDAVVLFLGNEFKERRSEAVKLVQEGYVNFFIIPAYGRLVEAQKHPEASKRVAPFRSIHYPSYYEDTHIEIIETKKLMDKKGLRSAIFVSSPYHMRRIKTITDRVFPKDSYTVVFVPTRFEKVTNGFWFLNESDLKKVASEYGKIAWFFIYQQFK